MAHKTRIDLAAREIIGGKDMVNNAVRTKVKGRTLVDNTYRDIFFGIPIGDLDVGETVLMDIDGKETEFLIVNQGNPDSSLYDASCNGSWLLSKNIIEEMVVKASDKIPEHEYYENSNVHEYLNGDFVQKLDTKVQNVLTEVKIPYYEGINGVIMKGSDGLLAKVFLLSFEEVNIYVIPPDAIGSPLSYFEDDKYHEGTIQNPYLVATLNGVPSDWMTRNVGAGSKSYGSISENGNYGLMYSGYQNGIRPVMILPFETRVTNTRHRIMG